MASMPLKYYVAAAFFLVAFLKTVSMKKSLLCRPLGKWTRCCQWCLCSLCVLVLLAYNTAPLAPCVRHAEPSSSPPPSVPAPARSCAPCPSRQPPPPTTDRDDPIARLDLGLGRWDATHNYRMYDYAAVGRDYSRLSRSRRVCLATQSSVERLDELRATAARWSGPMSVAVYAAGDELRLLRAFVVHARRCSPEWYARLALHVVVAAGLEPLAGPLPPATLARVMDCTAAPISLGERRKETARWRLKNPYPQNLLRNVARRNCQSSHVFLVDVDIVPSDGMAEALDEFLTATPSCPLCAYVVPTYELDDRYARFPRNKTELIRFARKGLAVPFHKRVFIYNQYASNFSRWEASGGNESSAVHVSHNVTNFELLYEPFYIAPDTVPEHDERFLGYGYTRNTQRPPLGCKSTRETGPRNGVLGIKSEVQRRAAGAGGSPRHADPCRAERLPGLGARPTRQQCGMR